MYGLSQLQVGVYLGQHDTIPVIEVALLSGVLEFPPEEFYLGGAPPNVATEISRTSLQGCLHDFSFTTDVNTPRELVNPALHSTNRYVSTATQ